MNAPPFATELESHRVGEREEFRYTIHESVMPRPCNALVVSPPGPFAAPCDGTSYIHGALWRAENLVP